MFQISEVTERASGLNRWSIARRSGSNNDDHLRDLTPSAIAVAALDEPVIAPAGRPHRPWLVPGIQDAI
jgi:hypothetical protein